MIDDSRSEIVIVTLAGLALLALWLFGRGHAAGVASTLPVPSQGAGDSYDLGGNNLSFPLEPTVPGYRSSVLFPDIPLPVRSPYAAGQVNSCGCNEQSPQYFGSVDDLIAYLNENPAIPADFEDGLRNYPR